MHNRGPVGICVGTSSLNNVPASLPSPPLYLYIAISPPPPYHLLSLPFDSFLKATVLLDGSEPRQAEQAVASSRARVAARRIAARRSRSERPLPRKVAVLAVPASALHEAPSRRRSAGGVRAGYAGPATLREARGGASVPKSKAGGGGGAHVHAGTRAGTVGRKSSKRPAVRHQVRLPSPAPPPSSENGAPTMGAGAGAALHALDALKKANNARPPPPPRRRALQKPKPEAGPTEAEVAAALQAELSLQKRREDGRKYMKVQKAKRRLKTGLSDENMEPRLEPTVEVVQRRKIGRAYMKTKAHPRAPPAKPEEVSKVPSAEIVARRKAARVRCCDFFLHIYIYIPRSIVYLSSSSSSFNPQCCVQFL